MEKEKIEQGDEQIQSMPGSGSRLEQRDEKAEVEVPLETKLQGGSEKVGQEQIHDMLFGEKLSWQAIIYDLINTEQLDPWDIDLVLLSNRFLEKVREMEEANFFVSSKVLLASALFLRIKSDILLNRDIPGLDDILFGVKKEEVGGQERLELDEEVPDLVPRTPLSRLRKVTLKELMTALGKAIKTENRRIKREVIMRQYEREAEVVVPKRSWNLRDKIKDIYSKLKDIFGDREEKLAFSELLELHGEDRVAAFVSLLHLDNQQKVWLEQEGHFEEIWILLKGIYERQNKIELDRLKAEVEALEASHV